MAESEAELECVAAGVVSAAAGLAELVGQTL